MGGAGGFAPFPPHPPSYINMSSLLRVERGLAPAEGRRPEYEQMAWRLRRSRGRATPGGLVCVEWLRSRQGPRPRFNRRARLKIIPIKIKSGLLPSITSSTPPRTCNWPAAGIKLAAGLTDRPVEPIMNTSDLQLYPVRAGPSPSEGPSNGHRWPAQHELTSYTSAQLQAYAPQGNQVDIYTTSRCVWALDGSLISRCWLGEPQRSPSQMDTQLITRSTS